MIDQLNGLYMYFTELFAKFKSFEYRSAPCSYEHYWTSSWNKAWKKNSGLYGIWTHDLYDTGSVLYKLS